MIPTKIFILMVLPLIFANASPLSENSEKMPARSEIIFRIKRLMKMLHQKDYESSLEREHYPIGSQRRHMLERRQKLEALLERNPGLRTLLKSALEKRKAKEAKMLQSDACRPGLFYCDDRDSSLNKEDNVRRAALNKILHMKKQDAGKYCPPGFFYCPNRQSGDDIDQQKRNRLALLDKMFAKEDTQKRQPNSHEMEDLERIESLSNDKKELSKRKQAETEKHKVEFIHVPASTKDVEKSDESLKSKTSEGEKLADELMKSLQDTSSSKIAETNQKPANQDESNFDLKQLAELLEETKR